MKSTMCVLAFIALVLAFVLGAIQWNQIVDLQAELEVSRQQFEAGTALQVEIITGQDVAIFNLELLVDKYKTLYEQRYQPDYDELSVLLYFNRYALKQHQFYVDNTSMQNVYTGDTSFQEWVIDKYKRTDIVLEALRKEVSK